MALRIWLPLNGNLNNYGDYLLSFPNVTTFNSNGVLNKYLYGKGWIRTTSNLSLVEEISSTNKYTVSLWARIKDNANYLFYFGTDDSNGNARALWYKRSTNNFMWAYSGTGTDLGLNNSYINDLTNFHHYTVVINGSNIRFFVDGKFYSSKTASKTQKISGLLCLCPSGADLNDFRIYDHCLNDSEVLDVYNGINPLHKLKVYSKASNSIKDINQYLFSNEAKNIIIYNYGINNYIKTNTILNLK